MTKSTPHNTGDIRCKGTKSDEDLAREWIKDEKFWLVSPPSIAKSMLEHKEDIEKELGKERLEFLVFKIKTEEKLESLAVAFRIMKNRDQLDKWMEKGAQPWYKRLFSL